MTTPADDGPPMKDDELERDVDDHRFGDLPYDDVYDDDGRLVRPEVTASGPYVEGRVELPRAVYCSPSLSGQTMGMQVGSASVEVLFPVARVRSDDGPHSDRLLSPRFWAASDASSQWYDSGNPFHGPWGSTSPGSLQIEAVGLRLALDWATEPPTTLKTLSRHAHSILERAVHWLDARWFCSPEPRRHADTGKYPNFWSPDGSPLHSNSYWVRRGGDPWPKSIEAPNIDRWRWAIDAVASDEPIDPTRRLIVGARDAYHAWEYRTAVIDASAAIERSLFALITDRLSDDSKPTRNLVLELLDRRGLGDLFRFARNLGADVPDATDDLAGIRNKCVHKTAAEPSRSDAVRFLDVAVELAGKCDQWPAEPR